MASAAAENLMECPICMNVMNCNIRQCQQGHSFCETCVISLPQQNCPNCRLPIGTARNYQLEDLIKGLIGTRITLKDDKRSCPFAAYGCKETIGVEKLLYHELNCKYRVVECEMKTYAKTDCDWIGKPSEILQHFRMKHPKECKLSYKSEAKARVDLSNTIRRLQVIDMHDGQELIFYKCKIDTEKQLIFFIFQVVGLSQELKKYCYEFEITSDLGEKLKATMICESNCEDTEKLFEEGKSAAFTFANVRRFLNKDSEIDIRFRIMNIKHLQGNVPATVNLHKVSKHVPKTLLESGKVHKKHRHHSRHSSSSDKKGDDNDFFKC